MTDLEGVSCVGDTDDYYKMLTDKTDAGYQFAVERLMLDLNAAVGGAFDGGAQRVLVIDGHGSGVNFIKEKLDSRAEQVSFTAEFMKQTNACMVVGLHAMAGTLNGYLDHTQSSMSWYNYYVNGRKHGEFGQWALFAGAFNIPVVMAAGDEAASAEARAFVPEIVTAVVKQGIGRHRARLVDSDEALRRIREAAKEGVQNVSRVKPYTLTYPLDIKLEFYRSDMADAAASRPGVERLDARTVRKVLPHPPENFSDLLF